MKIKSIILILFCAGILSPAYSADYPTALTNVVMLGDSTTLCRANKPGAKLTDYVQTYLTQQNLQAKVVNSGVGGDTAKGGYARLQSAVLAYDPVAVTISFGLNDTGKLTPKEYREWMEKILQKIQKNSQAKILLITSTPFNNDRHVWKKRFKGGLDQYMDNNICAAVRTLAKKYNIPLCDLHGHFVDQFKKRPRLIDELILPDGVHLTDKGNEVAAKYVAPFVAGLLAKSSVALNVQAAERSALPKALIIGDSISISYTKPLTKILKGKVVVVHNRGNAGSSKQGLANLERYLGKTKWDIIHFNHGMHDLRYLDNATGKDTKLEGKGHIKVPIEAYEKNIKAIVLRLKKTGAKLIFATTTPYPAGMARPMSDYRQSKKYNKVALKIMKKHNVAVNDLYTFVKPRLKKLQIEGDIHFNQDGSDAMAEEVAKQILKIIETTNE